MTLKNVQPGTIDSNKLIALVLIALGIVIFALQSIGEKTTGNGIGADVRDEGADGLSIPPMAIAIFWASGLILLVVAKRKWRNPQATSRGVRGRCHRPDEHSARLDLHPRLSRFDGSR